MRFRRTILKNGAAIGIGVGLVTAGALGAPTPAFAANAVANGSFELPITATPVGCGTTPVGNWTKVLNPPGPQPSTIVTSLHHGGKHAAQLHNEPLNGDPDGSTGFVQQFTSVTSTKVAKLSTWIYQTSNVSLVELELRAGTDWCTNIAAPNPISIIVNGLSAAAFGPDNINSVTGALSANAWHKVSASYSYKTRRVSIKIDKGPKVLGAVGPVVAGYTGPAHLWMGTIPSPTSVSNATFDSVKSTTK